MSTRISLAFAIESSRPHHQRCLHDPPHRRTSTWWCALLGELEATAARWGELLGASLGEHGSAWVDETSVLRCFCQACSSIDQHMCAINQRMTASCSRPPHVSDSQHLPASCSRPSHVCDESAVARFMQSRSALCDELAVARFQHSLASPWCCRVIVPHVADNGFAHGHLGRRLDHVCAC